MHNTAILTAARTALRDDDNHRGLALLDRPQFTIEDIRILLGRSSRRPAVLWLARRRITATGHDPHAGLLFSPVPVLRALLGHTDAAERTGTWPRCICGERVAPWERDPHADVHRACITGETDTSPGAAEPA